VRGGGLRPPAAVVARGVGGGGTARGAGEGHGGGGRGAWRRGREHGERGGHG
jgi:hypothetical protein